MKLTPITQDHTDFPIPGLVIARRGGTVHVFTTSGINSSIAAADFAALTFPSWARPSNGVHFSTLDAATRGYITWDGRTNLQSTSGTIRLNFSYPV